MADERVLVEVEARDLGGTDPLSRAMRRPEEIRRNRQELDRQRRSREAFAFANQALFGVRQARPIMAQAIAARSTDLLGVDFEQIRRSGVFLGEATPGGVSPAGPPAGGGGQRRDRRGDGGRRGVPSGLRDPLQIGQIFGGGPVSRGLGLRAGGLATLGGIGAGFLALDAAVQRLINTIRSINTLYQDQVKILTPFSPALAGAQAQREQALTLNRLALAQRSGAQLAQTFRAETEFRIAVENFMNDVTTTMAPLLQAIFEVGTKILEAVQDFGSARLLFVSIAQGFEPLLPGITAIVNWVMSRWVDDLEVDPLDDAFLMDTIGFFAEARATFAGARDERRPPGL